MARIFLTGASGFIGSVVVQQLGKNHQLQLLSRSHTPDKGFRADLADRVRIKEWLALDPPEVAVLLAWEGLPDYGLEMNLTNLRHQTELVQSLVAIGCRRIILAGSCWQYGNVSGEVNEQTPMKDVCLYGCFKNALLNMAQALARGTSTEVAEARIFYSYGPGQRMGSLIPSTIKTLLAGQKPELRTPNDAVDFIYIDDVARAIVTLVEATKVDGVYNVSSGHSSQNKHVVNTISQQLAKPNLYSDESLSMGWWGSNQKLRALGFVPEVSLAAGIGKTIHWLKEQHAH